MKNPCKIDARKSDAKSMKNERKWSPKGSQNPLKIEKSEVKNEVQKRSDFWKEPGRSGPGDPGARRQVNFKRLP